MSAAMNEAKEESDFLLYMQKIGKAGEIGGTKKHDSITVQGYRMIWMARAAMATPPQGELSALPELPEAVDTVRALMRNEWEYLTPGGYYYTADQMRAYGLLCRQSVPWNPTDKELVQMQEDARDAMLWRQSGDAADMLQALRRAALALAFAAESSPAMRDDYNAVSAAIAKATGEPG